MPKKDFFTEIMKTDLTPLQIRMAVSEHVTGSAVYEGLFGELVNTAKDIKTLRRAIYDLENSEEELATRYLDFLTHYNLTNKTSTRLYNLERDRYKVAKCLIDSIKDDISGLPEFEFNLTPPITEPLSKDEFKIKTIAIFSDRLENSVIKYNALIAKRTKFFDTNIAIFKKLEFDSFVANLKNTVSKTLEGIAITKVYFVYSILTFEYSGNVNEDTLARIVRQILVESGLDFMIYDFVNANEGEIKNKAVIMTYEYLRSNLDSSVTYNVTAEYDEDFADRLIVTVRYLNPLEKFSSKLRIALRDHLDTNFSEYIGRTEPYDLSYDFEVKFNEYTLAI